MRHLLSYLKEADTVNDVMQPNLANHGASFQTQVVIMLAGLVALAVGAAQVVN